jgi:hypothetical protein
MRSSSTGGVYENYNSTQFIYERLMEALSPRIFFNAKTRASTPAPLFRRPAQASAHRRFFGGDDLLPEAERLGTPQVLRQIEER